MLAKYKNSFKLKKNPPKLLFLIYEIKLKNQKYKIKNLQNLPVQIIENWLTDKQNEKASRIFDDKELQLKFKEYKPKEYRYHKYDKEKMIVKMSIDSKKIIIGE